MDRFLLKNIIIIILVLVNLFLAASLLMRQNSVVHSRRQVETQLTELFAADGMTLEKMHSPENHLRLLLSFPAVSSANGMLPSFSSAAV